ncbi:hypothetical protein V8F06_006278 [Rhypophila decipiens]
MPPPISQSTHHLFTTEEIVDQPAGFLREMVRALCSDDAVRTRASILLSKMLAKGDEKLQLDASKPLLPPGVKLCLLCKQEFKEEENANDACQYHDDGDETTAKDSITGASGAAIIVASTSGKLNLPKPTQTDVKSKTVPEGKSVCLQCKELYWEGSNRPRSCWFHDGSLILDSGKEVWEMFDYDREDEIDNDEMREEVPEGFYYECCGESGLSKGCKWGQPYL